MESFQRLPQPQLDPHPGKPDFLEHNLSVGDDEWVLPRDDRSIKEGVKYVMVLSACTADGEICSEVLSATFIYQDGKVSFPYAEFPVEPLD